MTDKFQQLEREDVVSVYSGQIILNNRTFTISEFIAAMLPIIKEKGAPWTEEKEHWFREGIDCKILKPGAKSWQRGKVRITLEFCPETLKVEEMPASKSVVSKEGSPLDDIRQIKIEESR